MYVYMSEYGAVTRGTVIKETDKGFKVMANWWGRECVRQWYRCSASGDQKTFLKRSDAVEDAEGFIHDAIDRSNRSIERMENMRINLRASEAE